MNQNFRLALIDLDGTLYRGHAVIPGAPAFVQRLHEAGIQPVYFTNNATRSPEQVVGHLRSLGFSCEPGEVCTSSQAAAAMVAAETGRAAPVVYVGMEGLRDALEREGLRPISVRDIPLAPLDPSVQGAVLGLNTEVTYQELAVFCRYVMSLGQFVLTNADVRLPTDDGFLPGNGALGRFVSTATGIEPRIAGKPAVSFIEYALQRYGATRAEAVVIGDNLLTDIEIGVAAGVYTIQVMSGVPNPQVALGNLQPDACYASVDDLFR